MYYDPQKPRPRLSAKKLGIGTVTVVVGLILLRSLFGEPSHSSATPAPEASLSVPDVAPSAAERLIDGTLENWRLASAEDRQEAAATMIARDSSARMTAEELQACIDEVAQSPKLQSQPLTQIAGGCLTFADP